MARKRRKRKAATKATAKRLTRCRSIQLLEEVPLREEAEELRQRYLKQLRAAQRSLERFEQRDQPEFERWRSAEFGSQLTQLRDLQCELQELAPLVEVVEEMHFYSGRPYRECYEQAKRAQEHPEEYSQSDSRRGGDSFFENPFGSAEAKGAADPPPDIDEMEEDMREIFSEILGFDIDPDDPSFKEGFEDFKRQFGFGGETRRGVTPKRQAPKSSDLKQAYRALARKLHPDHRKELDAFDAKRLDELWHETQTAYSGGDLEELGRIDALIDIEIHGVSEQTNLKRIEQAAERHRQSLRAIERSIRQARKHPAWMFSKKPARKTKLRAAIRYELEEEIGEAAEELAYCKKRIALWTRPRKPRQRKPRRAKATAKKTSSTRYAKTPPPEVKIRDPEPIAEEQMGFSF